MALAVSALTLTGAYAQTPVSADQTVTLAPIEVTGSLIRSTDRVTFNQVQVVTAQDIEASGEVTVADYLRDLPVNSASSWADNFAYGATGGAGTALRGLSEKYTLVLVDGIRVAPYGYPSNGTDVFVDLNSLPISSIERIEIVKTGAVSQYGSDAIAGVVNVITRKNFNGFEATAGYGDATHGGEPTRRAGVLGGFGDLDTDRYNVTASADWFLQGGYTLAERPNTRSQDYFGTLTRGADYWEPNGVGNGGAAVSPCPSGGSQVDAASLLNGPGSGTACAVDTANGLSLHPHEERFDAKVHGTFKASDTLEAFVDLWGNHNETIAAEGFNSINDSTSAYKFNPATGGITQVPNIVPGANPYNPYGAPTPLTYTFLGEPQELTVRSNFYRALAGLDGTFKGLGNGEWSWKASASHSESITDNSETGLLSVPALNNVLNSGVFDFANPSATPDGLAGLYTGDQNEAISKLDTFDASASTTDLFRGWAGPVGFGAGLQFLHESDYVTDYTLQSNALAVPFYLQAIDGSRNVAAVYYQTNVPLLSVLTLSQSFRYDHYSDFGSAYSPRIALRFQPFSGFTAYASYSRGFRAPTLAETSLKNSSGVQTAADPYSPTEPNVQENYTVLVGGNPNLGPEKTQNYNVGLEWEPVAQTALGLDWYRILIHNVIGTANMQTLVDANNPSTVVRNPNGTIAYVNFDYMNLNSQSTEGFELTGHTAVPTPVGTFKFATDWTYVWNFDQSSGGQTLDFAGNDGAIDTPYGASFPRWKGNTSVGWSEGPVGAVLTYLFTGPYLLTQMPGRVPAYGQVNLTATYSPEKHVTVYGKVTNLFDRDPPYDPLWLEFPTATPYDPSIYTNEGRYVEIGLKYRL
jgi:iron complex outermembrane recepter protein